jgi:hypothetical protein
VEVCSSRCNLRRIYFTGAICPAFQWHQFCYLNDTILNELFPVLGFFSLLADVTILTPNDGKLTSADPSCTFHSFVLGTNHLAVLGRLLRPDIVRFHFLCLGTEIFLLELTLSNTLSSNPESSRSVDLQFTFHKLQFYLHQFHDNFFHCSTTRIDDDKRLCHSKRPISINQSTY